MTDITAPTQTQNLFLHKNRSFRLFPYPQQTTFTLQLRTLTRGPTVCRMRPLKPFFTILLLIVSLSPVLGDPTPGGQEPIEKDSKKLQSSNQPGNPRLPNPAHTPRVCEQPARFKKLRGMCIEQFESFAAYVDDGCKADELTWMKEAGELVKGLRRWSVATPGTMPEYDIIMKKYAGPPAIFAKMRGEYCHYSTP